MDISRAEARGHCPILFAYLYIVWIIHPALGAFATKDAICCDQQGDHSRLIGGIRGRARRGGLRLRLLGAGGPSDCKCAHRCCRRVVCMLMEARPYCIDHEVTSMVRFGWHVVSFLFLNCIARVLD